MQPNVEQSGRAWHQQGQPTGSTWYSDGSLFEGRAGTAVVNGPMRIQARVPGPQTIYRAEMYGVWIAVCLAQPGDSIVLDNRAAAQCVSKPPSPQSSDYDLHDAAYQLISTKALQVCWARGHRDPKKAQSLQDYHDRIGNELADLAARAGSTMHPCRCLGSTSPAAILLNNHVMPSPARNWIIKSRPQKLVPEADWTPWLPLRAVNRDKWGPWLWGTLRWPGYGAPWETGPVLCPRCGQRHGLAVQECLLSCPSESRFWYIWTDAWETWKPEATKWRQTASADELRMCTRLQFPHSLQRSFLPVQAHWRVVVATWLPRIPAIAGVGR